MSRRHLSYANVTATLALVVALSTGAYAAATLPNNSVGTAQLKKGAVKTSDVSKSAVTGKKIKNRSVRAADLAEGVVTGRSTALAEQFLPTGCTDKVVGKATIASTRRASLLAVVTATMGPNDGTDTYDNRFDLSARLTVGEDSLAVASTSASFGIATGNARLPLTAGGVLTDIASGKPFRLAPGTTYQLEVVVDVSGACANPTPYFHGGSVTSILLAPS